MKKISFTCDYSEGAHPEILRRVAETNYEQEPGYGEDSYTASAREKLPDGRLVTRFATSWATPPEHIRALEEALAHQN